MEISESVLKEMADVIGQALNVYRQQSEMPTVTDIHILPVRESGELVVLDDDRELGRSVISELADIPEDEFYDTVESLLGRVLQNLNTEDSFDNLSIWKPFSFVMMDDDGDVTRELMLVDDDTQLVSQTLMADLDEDLEKFLKELLPD